MNYLDNNHETIVNMFYLKFNNLLILIDHFTYLEEAVVCSNIFSLGILEQFWLNILKNLLDFFVILQEFSQNSTAVCLSVNYFAV